MQAFSAHYLRLGAPIEASQKIAALVHKTSPGISAEPDMSRNPLKNNFEEGGRDMKGAALRHGEPTLPSRVDVTFSSSSSWDVTLNAPPGDLMHGNIPSIDMVDLLFSHQEALQDEMTPSTPEISDRSSVCDIIDLCGRAQDETFALIALLGHLLFQILERGGTIDEHLPSNALCEDIQNILVDEYLSFSTETHPTPLGIKKRPREGGSPNILQHKKIQTEGRPKPPPRPLPPLHLAEPGCMALGEPPPGIYHPLGGAGEPPTSGNPSDNHRDAKEAI